MAAGLPLMLVSLLSVGVWVAWVIYGPGKAQPRRSIGIVALIVLGVSWYVLINESLVSSAGGGAAIAIVVVSLAGFGVPQIWIWAISKNEETHNK